MDRGDQREAASRASSPEERGRAVGRRDAALARLGRARRWALLAAAGLSAGFAWLAYALAPGHSLTTKARAASLSSRSAVGDEPAMPAPASAHALGVGQLAGGSSQPATAPAPAAAPASSGPAVTSGGS